MCTFNRLYFSVLFVFVLSMNFQSLSIHGWIDENEMGSNVRIYHIISLFMLPLMVANLKYRVPKIPATILVFYSIIFFVSTWSLTHYSYNSLVFNYVFSFYCFVIGLYSSKIIGSHYTSKIFINVASVMLFCVIAKNIYFIDKIVSFLQSPFGHPVILWFYGGGANLEATWITMMSVFFIKNKSFYVYILLSFVICVIYSSRTSFILGVIALLFKILSSETRTSERRVLLAGALAVIIGAAFLVVSNDINIFLINRFLSAGEDAGSLARFELWENIQIAFENNLYGYGAGNAIKSLSDLTGKPFDNDNVHNYYAQVLLDFGLAGLVAYGAILLTIIRTEWKASVVSIEGLFLFLYFIGALLQFRGAEAFVWLLFGFYFQKQRSNKRMMQVQAYAT